MFYNQNKIYIYSFYLIIILIQQNKNSFNLENLLT